MAAEMTWKELVPLVDRFLAELLEHTRTPVLMHYLEGATQGEIANTLGVHQSNVSRHLSEGIEVLRKRLQIAGIVAPATMLMACLTSQTALAAPSSVGASLGKVSLAGIGAEVAGTSQMAWPVCVGNGLSAFLFLPLVAGVVWGVSFSALAMIAIFHTGFFMKNLIAAPVLEAQPLFARSPPTIVLPNEFIVSAIRLQEIDSVTPCSNFMGDLRLFNMRLAENATIIVQYADRSASLNVRLDERGQLAFTGVTVMVQVMPHKLQLGIPSEFAVSSLSLTLSTVNRKV